MSDDEFEKEIDSIFDEIEDEIDFIKLLRERISFPSFNRILIEKDPTKFLEILTQVSLAQLHYHVSFIKRLIMKLRERGII